MRILRLGLALFSVLVVSACATENPVAPTVAGQPTLAGSSAGPSLATATGPLTRATVVDQGSPATYDWHAGDAFLAGLNPAFSPDVSQAADGDRIEINGTGTLGLHPKSASGGGTFRHLGPTGAVLAEGTFTAVELLSFVSYGPSPATPPSFNSGKALLRVVLFPGGAGSGIEGTLRIECTLPQTKLPQGLLEGINLSVPGVANFQQQISGATVFIKTS